jgi:hypothetical protein
LQNVVNNLPNAYTDYNGVIKSWNPVINASEKVEVPKKTTEAPSTKKQGRVATTKMEKTRTFSKTVIVSQPMVERHHVDANDPQSSSQPHYTNEAGTSEVPDDLILENHETSKGIEEISIKYTSSRKVYDHSITILNICFSTVIAENILNNPDPKTMAEYKNLSDWNKWKEVIEVEYNPLKKRNVFTDVIPTPPKTFPIGLKWVFV